MAGATDLEHGASAGGGKIEVRCRRRPGHFWADNELLDVYGPRIGAYGVAVYMALSRFARNDSGECAASLADLARMLAIAKNTLLAALRRLEQEGLLAVARTARPGAGDRNVYTLLEVEKGSADEPLRVHHVNQKGSVDEPLRVHHVNRHKEAKLDNTGKTKTTHRPAEGCQVDPPAARATPAAPADDAGNTGTAKAALGAWREATGREPSRHDRATAAALGRTGATPAEAEAGVLRSCVGAPERPRSLAYCAPAVAEFAAQRLPAEALAAAAASARRALQRGWTRERLGPGMELPGDGARGQPP